MNFEDKIAEIANTLVDDISQKDSRGWVAWIGSGLSMNHYPSWIEILKLLCSACNVHTPEEWADPDYDPDSDELIELAEKCKIANQIEYERTIAGKFGNLLQDTPNTYILLSNLEIDSLVTTNFDPFLEYSVRMRSPKATIYSYPDLQAGNISNRNAFYMHGNAYNDGDSSGENIVMAESDFKEAYDDATGVVSIFIRSLWQSKSILFLGCELDDDYLKNCFNLLFTIQNKIIKAFPEYVPPKRFILLRDELIDGMDDDEKQKVQIRSDSEKDLFEGGLNIQIIRYPTYNRGNEHLGVERILRSIHGLQNISAREPIGPGEDNPK